MSSQPKTFSQPPPPVSSTGQPFIAIDWTAPLDVEAATANIPSDAQVAGMFFMAFEAKAKLLNVSLPGLRDRYVPFSFYPLTELTPLMLEAAKQFYPSQTKREALRTMGRAVPKALIASTFGRVVFGSAQGVHEAVEAMAKTYSINLRGSRAEVLSAGPNWMVVQLAKVYHFLDSHHVGIFDGTMTHAGVEGTVDIAVSSSSDAELLLRW